MGEPTLKDARAYIDSFPLSLESWCPASGRAISGPSQPFPIHPTRDFVVHRGA